MMLWPSSSSLHAMAYLLFACSALVQASAVSQPVTLSWRGPEPKKSIKLMGSFNDWGEPIALKKNR
jgi:hypothetical protein